MLRHNRFLLNAIPSAVAVFFFVTPAMAQSPVIVEATYSVSTGPGSTATFVKAQGNEKPFSIVGLKAKSIIINPTFTATPSSETVSFVLIGNPNQPSGGMLSRFEGNAVPTLDIATQFTFVNLDRPNLPFTLEYDGFADFPRYPLSPIGDLNGIAAFEFVFNVKDLGFPDPQKIALKAVKFSFKKAGKISILDTSIQIPDKQVSQRSKLNLDGN